MLEEAEHAPAPPVPSTTNVEPLVPPPTQEQDDLINQYLADDDAGDVNIDEMLQDLLDDCPMDF
jgi:hypothetical protein